MPKALSILGILGTLGLLVLSGVIFRKKEGQVDFNERDKRKNMTGLQKFARDNLILIALTWPFAALMTLMSVKGFGETLSVEEVTRNFTMWTYCILIVTALKTRKVFRMRKEGEEVYFDERDQLIIYRAVLRVYYVISIFLIVGLLFSLGFLDQPIGSVPFYALPLLLSSIVLVLVVVYSIAILIQYGRGGKEK